jgi:hypothetical protein
MRYNFANQPVGKVRTDLRGKPKNCTLLKNCRSEAFGLSKITKSHASAQYSTPSRGSALAYTSVFLLAVLVALSGMAIWLTISFAVMGVDQARYREVVNEAATTGSLVDIYRLPFAPSKEFYPHGGDDCLTLAMLIAPREARLKAAVSPMAPVGQVHIGDDGRGDFPPHPFCDALAAMLHAQLGLGESVSSLPEMAYYHRYIHGTVTIAAVLLSMLSFESASIVLLGTCYALLACLIIATGFRFRSKLQSEQRRAAAFLFLGLSLSLFYAIPLFGRSLSFAPIDIVVIGFVLFGLFQPLARVSETKLVLSSASFGTAIAIFDHLAGGIPISLVTLIVLVTVGESQDRRSLIRRLALALAAFLAAIVTCLACKQLLVFAIWGLDPVTDFANRLGKRTGGGVAEELSDSVKHRLKEVGLSLQWLDSNFGSRIIFAGIMVIYSAFVLGWGSHVLGAAIVILPVPLLLLLTYFATRGRSFQNWPLELLVMIGAAMIPFAWYLVFLNHTILHSSFMVRPLALSAGLVAVVWIYSSARGAGAWIAR